MMTSCPISIPTFRPSREDKLGAATDVKFLHEPSEPHAVKKAEPEGERPFTMPEHWAEVVQRRRADRQRNQRFDQFRGRGAG